ncbi:hypothetical protein Nhal_1749 [Nitrosococcus halophilus Nc 4]|uniref:Uncharacterized protein n=1 Tax=Nitrosococcus halophilus (strain Nc4) TaxID=472759 RepID=D5C2Y1_NITHN|nr:hypothetical protein [Nitrosococcus halophilus]ADE14873.1 hypothetical protein Nhal_1749 [Nitrosococcus halophilus Nc 4]
MSRYVTGLLLSSNKTLQGVYAQQVWPEAQGVSRRAMHTTVFEAGWDSVGLMGRHRAVVSGAHRGRGLEVMSLSIERVEIVPDDPFVVGFLKLEQRGILQPKHHQPRHQRIGQGYLAAFVSMPGHSFKISATHR